MTPLETARQLRARTDVHFNCAQSVLAALAPQLGLTQQQAVRLGANFGSGMRCGSACGALTAGLMALGLMGCGQERAAALLDQFRQAHGDINCPALLKAAQQAGIPRKEHCDGLVFEVVQALSE